MNYFSVEFRYDHDVHLTEEDDHRELVLAEKEATRVLKNLSLEYRHKYSWPDGSFHRYVKTILDKKELHDSLKKLSVRPIAAIAVTEVAPDDNHFTGHTVGQLFNESD